MELNIIHNEDCRTGMQRYPDNFFNCCVTSPPYWALRDYGVDGQLGLEATPEEFIATMVGVFSEVKRVLRDDGTLWINIGDCYSSSSMTAHRGQQASRNQQGMSGISRRAVGNIKPKDIVGIPWMLAFALRADGWYLRQDIIWSKPNPMPESVTDRCTKSHEYIFLLSKSEKYFYNQDAIKEPASMNTHARQGKVPSGWDTGPGDHQRKHGRYSNTGVGWNTTSKNDPSDKRIRPSRVKNNASFDKAMAIMPDKRNKRSVWEILPQPFPEAHFATFPEELPYNCILAGCPEGGNILDPFMGAGTTGLVARKLQRNYVGFELNPEYIAIAERRLRNELGMFL